MDMTTIGIEEMEAGQYKVRFKEVSSSRFDSKAFKVEHKELYAEYTKKTAMKRFTIA